MDNNLIVTIIFGVISTILTIITIKQGKENKRLNDQRHQVHNTAQIIIQNNNFQTLPDDIRDKINLISANSASTLSVEKSKSSSSISNVGLFIGQNNGGEIQNCHAEGKITINQKQK